MLEHVVAVCRRVLVVECLDSYFKTHSQWNQAEGHMKNAIEPLKHAIAGNNKGDLEIFNFLDSYR